jgi:hypothetical protein
MVLNNKVDSRLPGMITDNRRLRRSHSEAVNLGLDMFFNKKELEPRATRIP